MELVINGEPAFNAVVAHADDRIRALLVASLQASEELQVIAETADGAEALALTLDILPDVLVVGPHLSGESSADWVTVVHRELPICTIVAALDSGDEGYELLPAGALASVVLNAVDDPAAVIRNAAKAESVISNEWAKRLAEDIAAIEAQQGVKTAKMPELTPTEREVVQRLANGETPAQIAAEYEVNERLVNLHTGYAVSKLHWAFEEQRHIASLQDA